jgi:hypothetical protein
MKSFSTFPRNFSVPAIVLFGPWVENPQAILAPEEVFFEGPPSWTEMVIPGISILTVIGIVPFIATATRQAWVKYKITGRRISVTSGFNGQVQANTNTLNATPTCA